MNATLMPLFATLALAAGSATAVGTAPTATAVPAATSADTVSAAEVSATLQAAGYADIRALEFEDGVWEAEVRRANGLWGEVAVDAATGEVFDAMSPRPLVERPAVLAVIEGAGYRQVHELERDGALWEADAFDADGARVELRLSGHDGRIVSVSPDVDD